MYFTRVTAPNGRKFIAFVPRKTEEMVRGLGGKEGMSPETGMLFDFGSVKVIHRMTTAPMLFSLDMIWLDEGKNVKRVDRMVLPHHHQVGQGRYVLELVAGAADLYGISVGARLTWERPTK